MTARAELRAIAQQMRLAEGLELRRLVTLAVLVQVAAEYERDVHSIPRHRRSVDPTTLAAIFAKDETP